MVLSSPSFTTGVSLPLHLNIVRNSNIVMSDDISCVHPLSGMATFFEELLWMYVRVCFVFVNILGDLLFHGTNDAWSNVTFLTLLHEICVSLQVIFPTLRATLGIRVV